MDELIQAFPPIIGKNPQTLILGTMPGGKSLAANQYYAHPQNQFWKLMGDIYGAGRDLPYDERLDILKARFERVELVLGQRRHGRNFRVGLGGLTAACACKEPARQLQAFRLLRPVLRLRVLSGDSSCGHRLVVGQFMTEVARQHSDGGDVKRVDADAGLGLDTGAQLQISQ